MKAVKSFLAVLLVVLAGLTIAAGPAYADHKVCVPIAPGVVRCRVVHDPSPGGRGGHGGGGDGGGCHDHSGASIPCRLPDGSFWSDACGSYAFVLNPQPPLSDPVWKGHTTGVILGCVPLAGGGMVWVAKSPAGPPPALVLAQQAASMLRLPTLGAASNAGAGADATTYVGIPTWLWLQGPWVAVTSPPAAVAGESVTATATPTSVSWSMGDGHSTTCNGPGAPYSSADPSNPPCGYTYRVDSSKQSQDGPSENDRYFTVVATVAWSLTWNCTGAACDQNGGTLPDMTMPAPAVRWRVFQIETVVTGGH